MVRSSSRSPCAGERAQDLLAQALLPVVDDDAAQRDLAVAHLDVHVDGRGPFVGAQRRARARLQRQVRELLARGGRLLERRALRERHHLLDALAIGTRSVLSVRS